jgi:hypothetical protein
MDFARTEGEGDVFECLDPSKCFCDVVKGYFSHVASFLTRIIDRFENQHANLLLIIKKAKNKFSV